MDDIEVDVDIESEAVTEENVEEDTTASPETEVSPNQNENANQKQKFVRLPLTRIRYIMKKDSDCALISQDAAFLVTKATEMFIEFMTRESGKQLLAIGKRKTLLRRDVDTIIQNVPQLCFLDGAID